MPDTLDIRPASGALMELEHRYGAHNYHPLPVVLARGQGVYVWDVEGKRYYDFLSAYSAVNQGHGHPALIEALTAQAQTLALTSRAFYNNVLGLFEEKITQMFGFDKVLPMNSGAEAVETAIKLCRKWAYEHKGLAPGKAKIVVCEGNFHGRTSTIVSFSSDPDARNNFGPFAPGFVPVPYNDVEAIRLALQDADVAGVLVEPIQGEAGVMVPHEQYMARVRELCTQHGVLFMADEVQTGIGRTGSLLAVCGNCTCAQQCERQATYARPDILILGKALSGGMYPVSAVLADEEIMQVIKPGQHGSTFGGNPLASRVAMAALDIVYDEQLMQNARELGQLFRERMIDLVAKSPLLELVRGKGLLNALVIRDSPKGSTAWDLCIALMHHGLLAKPTHGNIIRFAPPLVITRQELLACCDIIEETVMGFQQG
ncbi:MAG: ornithine--oxo-acid transaminase [Bacteroidetes bacterium]|nr:ornithine--oxo-acid transaminase [Bacteroidota bacterium]